MKSYDRICRTTLPLQKMTFWRAAPEGAQTRLVFPLPEWPSAVSSYLLEAGLHQVLRKQVPDQVEGGVQAGDVVVLNALSQVLL